MDVIICTQTYLLWAGTFKGGMTITMTIKSSILTPKWDTVPWADSLVPHDPTDLHRHVRSLANCTISKSRLPLLQPHQFTSTTWWWSVKCLVQNSATNQGNFDRSREANWTETSHFLLPIHCPKQIKKQIIKNSNPLLPPTFPGPKKEQVSVKGYQSHRLFMKKTRYLSWSNFYCCTSKLIKIQVFPPGIISNFLPGMRAIQKLTEQHWQNHRVRTIYNRASQKSSKYLVTFTWTWLQETKEKVIWLQLLHGTLTFSLSHTRLPMPIIY